MALSPFLTFVLPLVIFIIGEIVFVKLFCRKQRPRIKREDVVGWCCLFTVVFFIANIFINGSRTEVWIVNSEDDVIHEYILLHTGEYTNLDGNYYVVNNTNDRLAYVKVHYGGRFSTEKDEVEFIDPRTTLNVSGSIDGFFSTPPMSIFVRRGSSTTRTYLMNMQQYNSY